jgi:hypothetical protein
MAGSNPGRAPVASQAPGQRQPAEQRTGVGPGAPGGQVLAGRDGDQGRDHGQGGGDVDAA